MDTDVVLEIDRLGKRFGKRWAVRDLNLVVRKGDIFGFLGPNGAGKSTTIRMILTLIRPTTGEVRLFGKSLRRSRGDVLARVGGMVERADFYLHLSARKNLEIVGALLERCETRDIDAVLDIVGLLPRAGDRVRTFSHGMKQRLGIAQALLGFPEFIVLDEPTTGLDPQGIKEVRDLIRRLSADNGMTVFLSSHLLHEIEQIANAMAIIDNGTLVIQGGVSELLSRGAAVVRLEALPAEDAENVVRQFPSVADVRRNGTLIEFTMALENTAALNRALVQSGIEVRALVPRRSLEEYFLTITAAASESRALRGPER